MMGGGSSYAMRLLKLKAMTKNSTSSYEYYVATTNLLLACKQAKSPSLMPGNLGAFPEHLSGCGCLTTWQHSLPESSRHRSMGLSGFTLCLPACTHPALPLPPGLLCSYFSLGTPFPCLSKQAPEPEIARE